MDVMVEDADVIGDLDGARMDLMLTIIEVYT